MKTYRAFISVPIVADDDAEARSRGFAYAANVKHLEVESVTVGHLELLGESAPGALDIFREVYHDPESRFYSW